MNNLMNNVNVFCISLNLDILGILILHFIIQKKIQKKKPNSV